MSKEVQQSNFNSVEGAAEFKDTAMQSYSASLRFSPELVYILPAQICFSHKLTRPFEINGEKYEKINSVLMVGVDPKDGAAKDLKVVPVSNLTRTFYANKEVKAVKNEKGLVRGEDTMQFVSNVSTVVEKHGKNGRKITVPVAYSISVKEVYVPKFKENEAKGGFDFEHDPASNLLTLQPKGVAIFNETTFPASSDYKEVIPDQLLEYLL